MGATSRSLRILTFNIWFDSSFQQERMNEVLNILEKEDPDVICIQEATRSFEEYIISNKFARKHWLLTSLREQQMLTDSWYGTMMAVKKSFLEEGWMPQTYFLAFPGTECGRGLQLLEMQLPGEEGPVSTSRNHLLVFTRVPRKDQRRQYSL